MRFAIMMGALALTGCAASAEMQASERAAEQQELADALKGRVAGKTQECIQSTMTGGPQIIGNTLLYRQGRRIWRTDVEGSCPGLHATSTIVVELHGTQLCRRDKFRAIEPGASVPGGYCFMGPFTEYRKP